ncbi:MAG: DM13 domain-containing protein [Nanoarchaeota archaeon]
MSYMRKKILMIVIVILLLVAYYLISPLFIVKEVNDELPMINYAMDSLGNMNIQPVNKLLSSNLVASAHDVSGRVAVYDNIGQRTLRFENLNTVNGPDLFIYLATDTTAKDFVNLGEVKATKGNVNYDIPIGLDLEKYDTVLIWCRAFRTLFSYAELNKK